MSLTRAGNTSRFSARIRGSTTRMTVGRKPSISRKQSRFAARFCISRALLQMLDVLFDNGSLLVINKPSGVSVLDDRTGAPCLLPALEGRVFPARVSCIDWTKAPAA